MSETDSCKSQFDDSSEFDQESRSEYEGYVNERGDRHSEESSGYYFATPADQSMANKKYVKRYSAEKQKSVRVEFFPTTSIPNGLIKHAITGTFQGIDRRFFKVGTKDEDLFFTVILATGELGQNAPVMFFDNPEQYEKHFFTKVSQSIKDNWTVKKNAAVFHLNMKQIQESKSGVVLVK